jgi:hypothetical protein
MNSIIGAFCSNHFLVSCPEVWSKFNAGLKPLVKNTCFHRSNPWRLVYLSCPTRTMRTFTVGTKDYSHVSLLRTRTEHSANGLPFRDSCILILSCRQSAERTLPSPICCRDPGKNIKCSRIDRRWQAKKNDKERPIYAILCRSTLIQLY